MTIDDRLMRRLLLAAAAFNFAAAPAFAFPGPVGRLTGLSGALPEAPLIYTALAGLFVVLFGGSYAWLAMQSVIHRPMVGLAAIGKAGAFTLFLVLWLAAEASTTVIVAAAGDLVFAALFARWLAQSPRPRT